MCETARDPRAHRYSASRGIKGLRKAHCAYYKRRFGVDLNPDREVIAALGSKEGFANLAMAITAPGDVVLVPNPAYPIHAFGFMIAGAAIRHVPATSPEEYLSKIGVATRHSVSPPLAMVVNYPSNPTAQVVDSDFYKEGINICQEEHKILGARRSRSMLIFISTTPIRRPRSCKWMAQRISPLNSSPCPRPIPCRAGAWVSRQAMKN